MFAYAKKPRCGGFLVLRPACAATSTARGLGHIPTTERIESLSLTAPERETVINFSDEDDTATIHAHQRRIITKLLNNPAVKN
jgi:hypothetical protein